MKSIFTILLLLPFAVIAAETNDVPKLVPAYGELPPTFWEQHQTPILIGIFALLAFAFLFVKTMLRPESTKILPSETVARQSLAKLQGQPENGKLLSEVSQILRRYFSAAFRLPATEMTTAEFCAALVNDEKIGTELAQMIASFLRVCDQDKFSPKIIAPPMNAVDRARELISRSEARCLRSAPVPGAATRGNPAAIVKSPAAQSSGVAASGDGRTP
ncbi:MAG: hypothetical protein WCK57_12910 [Verrucomicrobiae bacterium]